MSEKNKNDWSYNQLCCKEMYSWINYVNEWMNEWTNSKKLHFYDAHLNLTNI